MSRQRVLLTGAAGKVGRYVAPQLAEQGFDVYGTDVLQPGQDTEKSMQFRQCDLTQCDDVAALLVWSRPDVVLHTAAIVAPISYTCSEIARKVNLEATRYLIAASEALEQVPYFVFCSSYTVHGPCAPGAVAWNADTAYAPVDDYGCQKVRAEECVQRYTGSWSILRIGGVFDAEALMPSHSSFKAFAFMVPLAQREHGVDVLDVVASLVGAARVKPQNRVLMIGGDASWCKTACEIRTDLFAAMGLSAPHPEAYRRVDSAGNSGWYCENWMDTTEAQKLLRFQRNSYDQFIARVRKKSRLLRWLSPLLGGFIERKLYQGSPYLGEQAIVPGASIWDDITAVYEITDEALNIPESGDSLRRAV